MQSLLNLKNRAQKALLNKDEICDEFCKKALSDSDEMCKGRAVLEYVKEDFAYIRLKIYLKVELNGEDELLYQNAIKEIKASPFVKDEKPISSVKPVIIKSREGFL